MKFISVASFSVLMISSLVLGVSPSSLAGELAQSEQSSPRVEILKLQSTSSSGSTTSSLVKGQGLTAQANDLPANDAPDTVDLGVPCRKCVQGICANTNKPFVPVGMACRGLPITCCADAKGNGCVRIPYKP
jgi:hypothetical protein